MDHMTDQTSGPVGPDQARRTDVLRTIGIVVVGLSAAVLSFQTWVQVAQSIGFTSHWSMTTWTGGPKPAFWIAWLYPVAIDCFAMLVTREWMRSKPDSSLRAWARANSIGAIVLSYGGQAAYHAFEGSKPPVAYVIFMGGMPPLIVGLVVHLYTKQGAIETTPVVRTKRTAKPARITGPTPAAGPDQTIVVQPTIRTTGPDDDGGPSGGIGPDHTTPTPGPRTNGPSRPRTLHVVHGVVPQMADQLDRAFPDQVPARRTVMDQLGWKSAAQASAAINLVRERRAATDGPGHADDSELERVEATA